MFCTFHRKCKLSTSTFTDYVKDCDSIWACCLPLDPDQTCWICQTKPQAKLIWLCLPKAMFPKDTHTLCQILTETLTLSTLVLCHKPFTICVRLHVNEELISPVATSAVFWRIVCFPADNQVGHSDSAPRSDDKKTPKPRTLFPETWIWDLVSVGLVTASTCPPQRHPWRLPTTSEQVLLFLFLL